MFKNNLFKLNLNSAQIIKYGYHIGSDTKKLDYSNIPYLCGIKNKISYIDPSESVLQIRRLAFIQKKILLKNGSVLVHNNRKSRILKALNTDVNSNNLFNIKITRNFKFGLVSNKEIRNKFLSFKKFNYNKFFNPALIYNDKNKMNFLKNSFYYDVLKKNKIKFSVNAGNKSKITTSNKYPNLLVLLGYDKNALLEFKNKNILSSCLIDTNNFHYVSDYNLLLNNKSLTSLTYFSKILKM